MTEPEHYKGREHSGIKHYLLENYLEILFMVIGRYVKRICYIDCFSGPWQESDEDLSGTSIALSLKVMQKCRDVLRKQHNKNVEFRALFIEKHKRSHEKLAAFLKDNAHEGIDTFTKKGEFHQLTGEILEWCGHKDFTFFFIDPKGWKKAIEIPTLTPLLLRPNSEYLINFMYDFVLRFHTQDIFLHDMQAIFGETLDTAGMIPEEKEEHLITKYRESLKRVQPHSSGKVRSAYVSILDRLKERTKYHLVYLTRHPLGIIKFMEISEKMDKVQKKVRAKTKLQRRDELSGQDDLFSDDDIESQDETVDLDKVKIYWQNKLTQEPQPFGNEQLADMLEETNWFETNLQQAFLELLEDGKVKNLDATAKRTKRPVHFEKNERLQRI